MLSTARNLFIKHSSVKTITPGSILADSFLNGSTTVRHMSKKRRSFSESEPPQMQKSKVWIVYEAQTWLQQPNVQYSSVEKIGPKARGTTNGVRIIRLPLGAATTNKLYW